jgi:hypothetical protein
LFLLVAFVVMTTKTAYIAIVAFSVAITCILFVWLYRQCRCSVQDTESQQRDNGDGKITANIELATTIKLATNKQKIFPESGTQKPERNSQQQPVDEVLQQKKHVEGTSHGITCSTANMLDAGIEPCLTTAAPLNETESNHLNISQPEGISSNHIYEDKSDQSAKQDLLPLSQSFSASPIKSDPLSPLAPQTASTSFPQFDMSSFLNHSTKKVHYRRNRLCSQKKHHAPARGTHLATEGSQKSKKRQDLACTGMPMPMAELFTPESDPCNWVQVSFST